MDNPRQVDFGASIFADISSVDEGIARFLEWPGFDLRDHLDCGGDHKVEMQLDDFVSKVNQLVRDTVVGLGWSEGEDNVLMSRQNFEKAVRDGVSHTLSGVVGRPFRVSVGIERVRSGCATLTIRVVEGR